MLQYQFERARLSSKVDRWILATSADASDDPIASFGKDLNIDVVRGDLDDVLDRFYQAARSHQPDHVVRLTGDCPLSDPTIIDKTIDDYLSAGADYGSNVRPPTFPDGLDVEIFRWAVLEEAWKKAQLKSEREHVTPYMVKEGNLFKHSLTRNGEDMSRCRWTVDEPEDFEFVRQVFEGLYPSNPKFQMKDVFKFIQDKPELVKLNAQFERNEGLKLSEQQDV